LAGKEPARKRSAGRECVNTHGPLTTTNSSEELIMAKANSKARARLDVWTPIERIALQDKPDYHGKPFLPWRHIADRYLASLGFRPGERVYFSVNYQTRQICISADHG
jgi:toxic protein SymE